MKLDFFEADEILRLTRVSETTVAIADKILDLEITIFPTLAPVRVGSLEDLWEMQFPSTPSTYALYVYALYPISYLLNAFEVTGRSHYLENALSLTESFLKWENSGEKRLSEKRLKILSGDHAVSNRTQCLCYLVAILLHLKREVPDSVKEALLKNGEYLADLENYRHYNHGLMMDLALLGLIRTLNHIPIRIPPHFSVNLVSRLRISLTRDLTSDGVHVENSPGYHFWMLGFLRKIVTPLSGLDSRLHQEAKNAFKNALEYATYITRPDGTVPPIGDTHANLKAKPSVSLGSRAFLDSNQVIFRHPNDDVWCFFGSGYKTHVHKHSDNGSFVLNYKGKDIFIDSGFLNYENSKESKEIKMARFHNTVAPSDSDQKIIRVSLSEEQSDRHYSRNLSGSRILCYQENPNYEYAIAQISDYEYSDIVRLILWIKGSGFVLYDTTLGFGLSNLDHYFNIGSRLLPRVCDSGALLFDQDVKLCVIRPTSVGHGSRVEIAVEPSYFSDGFNSMESGSRVVIKSKGLGCLIHIDFAQDERIQISGTKLAFTCEQTGQRITLDLKQLVTEALRPDG